MYLRQLSLCLLAFLWAACEPAEAGRSTKPFANISTCDINGVAPKVKATKANVWSPISPGDNLAVWNLLHQPATGLNLTDPSKATITDNYVYWIDTLPTNKSNVLPYLHGAANPPPKYARVVIFRGGQEVPDSQEYMVGPLPVTADTRVEELDYIFNGGTGGNVPFNSRYFDAAREAATEPLLVSVMRNISDITSELIGGVYHGMGDNRTTLHTTSGTPMSYDGTQAFRTVMFRYPNAAAYLTPLDFFVMLDITGTDASRYRLRGIVTNERFFPTTAAIRAAWVEGGLKKQFKQTRNPDWAFLDYKSELGARDLEHKLAPQSLEIGGKRYKIDEEEKYIEYMGWSFYTSYSRTLGLMYYDIRFKGDSVIYELSLQEATAQYAGFTPSAAGTVYQDTHYSLGTNLGTLVEGYDCPFGSTFWNVTHHEGNSSVVNTDAICIFEADAGYPISRHRFEAENKYGFSYLGTVKASALTMRSIATVGNYDYMFDYSFHVDGSLEVVVRASGFIQASFYHPDQEQFGPRVQEATMGSLHDHVLTYKADFDIVDTKNSLEVSQLVLVNQTQPWYPELGFFEQMQLQKSTMKGEQQFNWQPNQAAMYCVVNPGANNSWGEKRGYRIIPGRSNIHLTSLDSPWTKHQSPFAKSHLALSRQHDNEPYANSHSNVNLPLKPQQDFLKFFDGESVENEDIVLWFNLGMHHFTRSEDVPVTLYNEAVSSIVFAPQNFHDRAQDGDLRNRRWISVNRTSGELRFDSYGVELPSQCRVEFSEPVLGIKKNEGGA
ncbi:Amine oxidase [Colletotrichum higginsianum IMI 349063]|uniref:Amine oxidase n=4 Tax=Colletotrichum higginsianum TaxID=80884 RepID=A0A1B7YL22_COLHI|nr:Amine oxidase [Colletotrichum higginsianum IMI 349063]OBR12715.1 Amine oxidase [Colletotrichum higginsianum IMI 349063]TIC99810.1 Amiloride-sensitive amine oxidase [copper-containing] [Colletotrichum higginsianum]